MEAKEAHNSSEPSVGKKDGKMYIAQEFPRLFIQGLVPCISLLETTENYGRAGVSLAIAGFAIFHFLQEISE